MLRRFAPRLKQRGLSLVELMVGISIGLFVLAAAAAMTVTQLSDNRLLLLETQVQQDLRMAADLVSRDVRRASHAGDQWVAGVWPPAGGAVSNSAPNPFADFVISNGNAQVDFEYWDSRDGLARSVGYRLQGTRLQSQVGGGGWQDLTDPNSLRITRFNVERVQTAAGAGPVVGKLPCPRLCPDGTTACWPAVQVQDVRITIEGSAVSDARVQHRITRVVRLRNDAVDFLAAGGTRSCPT